MKPFYLLMLARELQHELAKAQDAVSPDGKTEIAGLNSKLESLETLITKELVKK